MAQITKRDNRWRARVRRNGQEQSKTFSTKDAAQRWARKTESEIENGIYLENQDAPHKITIREAANALICEYLPKLSDAKREENRLKAILERTSWGKCSLAQVRSKEIYSYIKDREKKVSSSTIRLDLALLSRLYKFAIQKYGLETLSNPVKTVERPSSSMTSRTRRLEEGEEEKLLAAAHQDLKPIIQFALETAMRREEIATLTWKNLNIEKQTAHLPRTKNGSARTVPLSKNAISILHSLSRPLDGGPVFKLTKDQITDKMRITVKRAGLKDLRFHDLRHEATSRFFENTTLDMMEVSRITGHKSLSMLSRYTHLRAENLAAKLG